MKVETVSCGKYMDGTCVKTIRKELMNRDYTRFLELQLVKKIKGIRERA